jgi:hypothetical protein
MCMFLTGNLQEARHWLTCKRLFLVDIFRVSEAVVAVGGHTDILLSPWKGCSAVIIRYEGHKLTVQVSRSPDVGRG